MNCIYSVSSAFTYSEFQRAKINGQNQTFENFSFRKNLPLPVRTFTSEKSTVRKTPFTNSEFQGAKFNRQRKNFKKVLWVGSSSGSRWKLVFYACLSKIMRPQVVAAEKAIFRTTFKFFLSRFLPRCEDQKCQPSEKIFLSIKNAPSIFWKTRAQDFCGIRL